MTTGQKIALVLSGGGFRATAYHLGVVSYLHAIGQLTDVTVVAGVSGGALLAADVVCKWDAYRKDPMRASAKLRSLIASGFRSASNRQEIPADAFQDALELLFIDPSEPRRKLNELSDAPELAIFATDIKDPGLVRFSKEGAFRLPLPDDEVRTFKKVADAQTTVGHAAAASAAFPGYFRPIRFNRVVPGANEEEVLVCQDGGLLDNTGLAGLLWSGLADAVDIVLLSDAGKVVPRVLGSRVSDEVAGGLRSIAVGMDAARTHVIASARATLGAKLRTTRIVMSSLDQTRGPNVGYGESTANLLGEVRTDLDAFDPVLCRALGHHAYWGAHSVLRGVPHANAPWLSQRPEVADDALRTLLVENADVKLTWQDRREIAEKIMEKLPRWVAPTIATAGVLFAVVCVVAVWSLFFRPTPPVNPPAVSRVVTPSDAGVAHVVQPGLVLVPAMVAMNRYVQDGCPGARGNTCPSFGTSLASQETGHSRDPADCPNALYYFAAEDLARLCPSGRIASEQDVRTHGLPSDARGRFASVIARDLSGRAVYLGDEGDPFDATISARASCVVDERLVSIACAP